MKKTVIGLALSLFPLLSLADIPADNIYQVKKRYYAVEPTLQQFTVSAQDTAYPVKPSIDTYTHYDPANPKSLFTVQAYPDTEYLPKLGKWMVIRDINSMPSYQYPRGKNPLEQNRDANSIVTSLVPAHWISLMNARGQYIVEPINYVFVVYEKNLNAASDKLNNLLQKIGFGGTASVNHSGGYMVYLGDKLLGQLSNKDGLGYTYSNNDFRFQNDHFRMMGGYPLTIKGQSAFVFAASLSQESGYESELAKLSHEDLQKKLDAMDKENPNIQYYENTGHHFVSFGAARNNLAQALIQAGNATYYVALGNVLGSLGESTGDHDGNVYVTVVRG